MLKNLRVVTLLMMVLAIFALLQLASGSLFFSSLDDNQRRFAASNVVRQQQSELSQTWELMLQMRLNLSRASARILMDEHKQQSSAKTGLIAGAHDALAKAQRHYAAFSAMPTRHGIPHRQTH